MDFITKHKLIITGILVGSLCGYAYYYFVGCNSGTCPITSNATNSSAYGALIGVLFTSSLKKQ